MWDGRVPGATVNDALADQSNGATLGHAAALQPLTLEQRAQIVSLETGLFTAQAVANGIGDVTSEGGNGGATAITTQAFVASRFNLFDAWATSTNATRAAAFRGQELFNTRTRPTGGGACRGCHSAENSGTNRNGTFFNVGTSDGSRRAADQPLYTFRNLATQEVLATTDPGRALITGRWADMNKFKVPSLRGLSARAPYFHGGSSNTLAELVKFYEVSLGFDFTDAEEADMVTFLAAL
jgi:cytochrome c peroxidase